MKNLGAIIGFGQVAEKAHAPAFGAHAAFALVAAADADPARQAAAAAAGLRAYATLPQLLAGEKGLSFVVIATPPSTHGPLVLDTLRRGLHVLCEKPLTLDPAELSQIESESQARDLCVFTVHNWAHAPIWLKAQSLVSQGAIGDVRHAELHVLRRQPAVSAMPGDWRRDPRLSGGGILVDHGWHNLYLLSRLLGGPEPLSVSARLSGPAGGVDEEATLLLAFPAATGVLHLTWRAATRANWAMIYGTRGALELRDDHLLVSRGNAPAERIDLPEALSVGSAHPGWLASMLGDFHAELTGAVVRGANLREAAFCLSVIRRAYDSAPREAAAA